MAQQNGGGFPFLPPPSMGAANPFSGLNAQQVTAFWTCSYWTVGFVNTSFGARLCSPDMLAHLPINLLSMFA